MVVALGKLFLAFIKVGTFGFGSGPAMIPLIQAEVVDVHHWLTPQEFVDALAMGNALPGPIAVKLAAFVGWEVAGLLGSLVAILGVSAPAAAGMLIFAYLLYEHKDNPRINGMFVALRPVVIGMLAWVVWTLFPRSVANWQAGVLALASFVVLAFLKVHPILVVVVAAALGVFFL